MRKSRFSEHQIVRILKSVEGGGTVKDVCRKHGMSNATYYKWKSKYGDMEASEIERMKNLGAENRKLKQMITDLSLENMALQDVIKKTLRPVQRKQLVTHMISEFKMRVRKACAALGVSRSDYAYKPHLHGDSTVIAVFKEELTRGFSNLFAVLRNKVTL